jgi:hypothetical protein
MRLSWMAMIAALLWPQSVPEPPFAFHHLHLNDDRPPFLLEFYERLFDPARTARVTQAGADGLRSGPMLLLISRGGTGAAGPPEPTALWHFGWGDVSLGETYLAHARHEVAWEPPLPADRLHLHVRSINPAVAANWYRDVLGARVALAPPPRDPDAPLPPPEHQMPEALVWLGDTGLLLYRTEPPLFSTRGKRADHLAVSCVSLDAALVAMTSRHIEVLEPATDRGPWRSAMIGGPDRMAIEIVERR